MGYNSEEEMDEAEKCLEEITRKRLNDEERTRIFNESTKKPYVEKEPVKIQPVKIQPVKRGRWKQIGEQNAKCTACGSVLRSNGIDKTGKALIFNAVYHYCPFCGARMDLKDGEQDD